ncbi:4Fe-4S binding protein [Puteibacter caeruleilacunae]|nr:4Fe-4S binding protein [Puteibacter caeruleilacunae]
MQSEKAKQTHMYVCKNAEVKEKGEANNLYRSKLFPISFQIISLIVLTFLIIGATGVTSSDKDLITILRNTNLANLIVWSYWWPAIILTAVFFGRHWCTVCPIELLVSIATKVGINKSVPKGLRSGWMIPVLYGFVAIVAISYWQIHRIPHRMALYLLLLMGFAVVISLIYKKRAFCSYFCPVGKLLGLYSLLSKFGIRVKDKSICDSCKTKDCISNKNQTNLIGRSCTSNIYPAKASDNRDCILCSQCVKSCSHNNIKLKKISRPYQLLDFNKLNWPEIAMIGILSGFVCYEILSSWSFSKGVVLAIPNMLHKVKLFGNIPTGLLKGLTLYLVIPAIYLSIVSLLAKLMGKQSFGFYLKRTAGFLIPLLAFGHVFKALIKTTTRIPYWEWALSDSNGIKFATQLLNRQIVLNKQDWLNIPVVILGVAGLSYAFYLIINKINQDTALSVANKTLYLIFTVLHFVLLSFGPVVHLVTR